MEGGSASVCHKGTLQLVEGELANRGSATFALNTKSPHYRRRFEPPSTSIKNPAPLGKVAFAEANDNLSNARN